MRLTVPYLLSTSPLMSSARSKSQLRSVSLVISLLRRAEFRLSDSLVRVKHVINDEVLGGVLNHRSRGPEHQPGQSRLTHASLPLGGAADPSGSCLANLNMSCCLALLSMRGPRRASSIWSGTCCDLSWKATTLTGCVSCVAVAVTRLAISASEFEPVHSIHSHLC